MKIDPAMHHGLDEVGGEAEGAGEHSRLHPHRPSQGREDPEVGEVIDLLRSRIDEAPVDLGLEALET